MSTEPTTQESPMEEKPGEEHEWLKKLVGEWTFESKEMSGEGQDVFRGSESVRSLGDLWVVSEGRGNSPGTESHRTLMTLGFNARRGRFAGNFVASMMTHQWVYDGAMSDDGKSLVLDCEGPRMSEDSATAPLAKYKDIIEFVTDDHRILRSEILNDDGQWQQFMRSDYYRVK